MVEQVASPDHNDIFQLDGERSQGVVKHSDLVAWSFGGSWWLIIWDLLLGTLATGFRKNEPS